MAAHDASSLRDLKNHIIGSTQNKIALAQDSRQLDRLLAVLHPTSEPALLKEAVAVVASVANAPSTTIPLALLNVPARMLLLTREIIAQPSHQHTFREALPHISRSLRNTIVSVADVLWGDLWGAGPEGEIVSTGLETDDALQSVDDHIYSDIISSCLQNVLESAHAHILLSLLRHHDPQVSLPVYHILTRLSAFPSHRQRILSWTTSLCDSSFPALGTTPSAPDDYPFRSLVVGHVISTIERHRKYGSSQSMDLKVKEASLELLAALVQGETKLATLIRGHPGFASALHTDRNHVMESTSNLFIQHLIALVHSSRRSLRLAALSCLISLIRSGPDGNVGSPEAHAVTQHLVADIGKLLLSDDLEERIKLNFLLAMLVADDPLAQASAFEANIPPLILQRLCEFPSKLSDMPRNLYFRSLESSLLALCALSTAYDPARVMISEYRPCERPQERQYMLPQLKYWLRSHSYGVRAAACQLIRALSRTVALLRTDILDEELGTDIIAVLRRELIMEKSQRKNLMGEAAWIVEVSATAVLCNMVTDFSPFRSVLVQDGTLRLLVGLTKSEHQPLALNALWAIKNLMFHSDLIAKRDVISHFGHDWLLDLCSEKSPDSIRVQGLEIMQNILAEECPSTVSRLANDLGGVGGLQTLLDLLEACMTGKPAFDGQATTSASLRVLSNLALGDATTRTEILDRAAVLQCLSTIVTESPDVNLQVSAITTFQHLIESSTRPHTPRDAVVVALQSYQLVLRMRASAENSKKVDVVDKATAVLNLLGRER
ncbi:hypothetical protein, variant 1 [Cryptococcus amylolentus CBS 6039]|uniref:Armadillo repeat-containing protein 8 n=1 Tax=Cryptococcus amylolentus CBS 6039 TaxID=1295533 RepID=A0A1E3HG72_9TREE|nr:hypothetical protein, variant 1 [Cryptococcus amylolentus CBS 6039]ODN75359.1 hypothetical protein, variant 1 [Cryptococcus amylolentus CBS 6039]